MRRSVLYKGYSFVIQESMSVENNTKPKFGPGGGFGLFPLLLGGLGGWAIARSANADGDRSLIEAARREGAEKQALQDRIALLEQNQRYSSFS